MTTPLHSPRVHFRRGLYLLPCAFGLLALTTPLQAQRLWEAGDGDWSTAGNWNSSAPTSITGTANQARFLLSAESPNASVKVTIKENEAAFANLIDVGLGKTVTLEMEAGSSLTAGSLWGIGAAGGTGTGTGHLTIEGPESGIATVDAGYFYVGRTASSTGGNTMTLTGAGLRVTDRGTSVTTVGRFTNGDSLSILAGAKVERYAFSLSHSNADGGRSGNTALISGTGSELAITGDILQIGVVSGSRSNGMTVESGGTLDVRSGKQTTIGHSGSYGGNYLKIGSGGTVKTNAALGVSAFAANGGDNDGQNYLLIDNGGTLISSASVSVSGLMQVKSGGQVLAQTGAGDPAALAVTVNAGGRLEAEGDGMDNGVSLSISTEGVLAIGEQDKSAAGALELSGALSMASGSVLEMSFFHEGADGADQIIFDFGSTFTIADGAELHLRFADDYTPIAGDVWTLFAGETSGISGNLTLVGLDLEQWDVSGFNELGGWQVVAIPEGSTTAYLLVALACAGAWRMSRRNRKSVSYL